MIAWKKWAVPVTAMAAGVIALTTFQTPIAAQDEDAPITAYREALGVLKREYFGGTMDAKKNKELTYEAIKGMLFSLNDPFTSFLEPDDWKAMQQSTRGDFEGIGAVLEPFGQGTRINRPFPDSPAFKSGLRKGDTILSVASLDPSTGKPIKTVDTSRKNINEVVTLIKGPKGTKVQITVARKDTPKPLTFVMTRAHIEPPIVSSWMEDDQAKIGHIVLNEFNEKSEAQFLKHLEGLEKQGMKALVFDLRYNPGGLLNVAVDIGSHFVDSGAVVQIQEKNSPTHILRSRPSVRKLTNIPMVVLINDSSASAAEIVSGAIQDNGVATLIGTHTFGKGLVQSLYQLNDGSALRLTTAKYFTSAGRDINNKYDDEHRLIPNTGGVKPDIVVEQSEKWNDQDFDDKANDVQLKKALEILRTKLASAKTAAKPNP
jgi:carboxyl-terminal processing protease